MAETSDKADVVPVKQEKSVGTAKAGEWLSPRRAFSPFEEMERLFEDVVSGGWLRPWRRREAWPSFGELVAPFEGRMPKVDIIDRENDVVVRAELPGVDKDDVDVSLTEAAITIKGSTKKEKKEEKGDYYRSETMSGAFARTLALPAEVNAAKAQAKFKDGLLEVTLPKAERAKRHTIRVE
jgi:HSP20 family protein